MDRRARITLIIVLFLAFLVIAPLLLLYTSGYRYSAQKHLIEKTGSLSVESEPRGAEVRVNGDALDRTTPAIVSRLLPETYTVEILAEGYVPWKKRLTVESGKTTFVKDVALLPESLPRIAYPADSSAAAWSPDGSKVALSVRDDAWLELVAVEFGNKGTTNAVLDRFPSDSLEDVLLSWAPDGRTVSATILGADDVVRLYLYDAQEDRDAFAVHDVLSGIAFAEPKWTDDAAVFLAAGGAYAVDLAAREASPLVVAARLTDIAVTDAAIWTLRTGKGGTILERRDADGSVVDAVAELTRPHVFVTASADTVILADPQRGDGILVDAVTGERQETSAYAHAVPHPDRGTSLLLCGAFEVATYDPSSDKEPRVVTRSGEPIRECGWHPSGQYAFFTTDERIYSIDLDDRDLRDTHVIADFDAVSALTVDADAALLRFVGRLGTQRGVFDRPL